MKTRSSRPLSFGPWWLQPVLTGGSLAVFVLYSTWAVFRVGDYHLLPYISPLYTPAWR